MRWSEWRPFVLAVVGVALAAVLAAAAWLSWAPKGEAGKAKSAEGRQAGVPFASDKSLGVNADLGVYEAEARAEALASMEAAGFRWLRTRFRWDAIELEPGQFDWAPWDEVVAGAARHNLKLIAVLDGAPGWARAGENAANASAPPQEMSDFGAFAFVFGERYGDQIDHYQIWDEPNIAPHWGAGEIDPAAYARLLREGAIQLRSADPGAVILAAALAPNVETGGRNLSEVHFLEALYAARAGEWFDVVTAQPYDFEESLASAPHPDQLNWARVELLREVMEAHGDDHKPVWAVSFGVQQETGGEPPSTGDLIGRAVVQSREDWPWLGPMLWAAWGPDDQHGEFAVTSSNGDPLLPEYAALSELAQEPAVAWPGAYGADHPSGHFEGAWRVTSAGADIGGSGDRLLVPFRGTRFDVTVRRGDYRAFLFASVDGQPANALPLDLDGRAYIVLYDPLHEVDTVTVARELSDGDHMAVFVAERGWGQWSVVGWSVSREDGKPVTWVALALLFASGIVLCATLYGSFPRRKSVLDAWRWLLDRGQSVDRRVATGLVASVAVLLYAVVGDVPSLLALGVLCVFFIFRPELALLLIAVSLPFYQQGKPLLGKVFSMVEILVVLAAIGWIVNFLSRASPSVESMKRGARRLSPLDWGVVALVLIGGASLLWAEHTHPAAREFRTVLLEAAVFYALLRVIVRDRRHAWRMVDAFIIGGAFIALIGAYQWVAGENVIAADGVSRVRGFYGSPNNLALYLGRVLPLAVAVTAWGVWERRRWAYAVASAVMIVAVLLTYSRGAWLLGIPAALLFLAAARGRRVLAIVAAVLVVGGLLVSLTAAGDRLTLLLDTGEGTSFFRLQLWKSSVAMVRDHPILGVGLDNFLYEYRTRYVLPTAWEEFNLSHPHNIVLDFWLRLGVGGLAVLGGLLVAFFRRGSWSVRGRQAWRDRDNVLALGLMAGVVYTVAHGLVDNAFFLVDLAFAFMLAMALLQVTNGHRQGGVPAEIGEIERIGGGC